ncbi:hypothetical protein Ancab_029730 [Ancistrocladus abbreviatus]
MQSVKFCFLVLLTSALVLDSLVTKGGPIQRKLVKEPKGTVKTLKGDKGDVIDCVNITQQPTFDHPLLRDHTLQIEPNSCKCGAQRKSVILDSLFDISWRKNGGCPKGLVPIVRSVLSNRPIIRKNMSFANQQSGHQADDYKTTGCYDLECPGWIQTSPIYSPGMPLQSSIYDGQQYELDINIEREQSTGNWWLSLWGTSIGYWPPSIFNGGLLTNGADTLSWGGEIYDSSGIGFHTLTQMGSGHFSHEGNKKACYVRNIVYTGPDEKLYTPLQSQLKAFASAWHCYDYQFQQHGYDELYFYHGGPGCNTSAIFMESSMEVNVLLEEEAGCS